MRLLLIFLYNKLNFVIKIEASFLKPFSKVVAKGHIITNKLTFSSISFSIGGNYSVS